VGILVRSAFLRGVLTSQVDSIPPRLTPVRDAALEIFAQARHAVQSLSEMALRFCLSYPEVSSTIIGVRSEQELESNVADAEKGALPRELVNQLCQVSVPDERLLDPQNWQDLI
jgi:aryl-alcohol dehydrogenase-like predicted oxidoreductase